LCPMIVMRKMMMLGMNKEKCDSERPGQNDDRWTRSIMTGVKKLEKHGWSSMGFGAWGIPINQSWNVEGYTNGPKSLLNALTIFSQKKTKGSKSLAVLLQDG
jgi:hypothetical protein